MGKVSTPKILIIGQCTLHWGRMEHGNIGNYYILEPLIRQLHRAFPSATFRTTLQLSDEFCQRESIESIPMGTYYSWSGDDLEIVRAEVETAKAIARGETHQARSQYIEEVLAADMVIDFSGDIWGDNADFLGEDRFEVGLCKNLIPQILGKPTAMIAGSPGPFTNPDTLELAKKIYSQFVLVTNREKLSKPLLENYGFDTSKTHSCACPAFLFEPKTDSLVESVVRKCREVASGRPLIGFIVCGWNFVDGPFDRWPRLDGEFEVFVQAARQLIDDGAAVAFMSHSNGFHVPPAPFELIHGRDHPIAQRLFELTEERGGRESALCINDILSPSQTKGLIGNFDMLVSGRIHGAVAGLSQCVPTAIIDYGHEPKAHKLRGFADVAGVLDCVVDPADELSESVLTIFRNRDAIQSRLSIQIPKVKELAMRNFDLIKSAL